MKDELEKTDRMIKVWLDRKLATLISFMLGSVFKLWLEKHYPFVLEEYERHCNENLSVAYFLSLSDWVNTNHPDELREFFLSLSEAVEKS